MSWRILTIGDLEHESKVTIQTGPFGTQLKASDYTETGVPVINVRNIGYGGLRQGKLEFVPENVAENLAKHVLKKYDIVFGRKGAVDRHLFVTDNENGWIQGSDCIRLRIHSDDIHPKYISYYLLRENHKNWMITQCSNKATMASLNQDVVMRIPLELPSLSQQTKIVEVLSSYDNLIDNNQRRIALLEKSARLLYKEWFVHLRFPGHERIKTIDGIPEGWELASFSDLASFLNGYAFKPTDLGIKGIPVVKIPELRDGPTDKTPKNVGTNIDAKYHIDTGDLLFSWSGTLLVNFWYHGPALLNQHLFKVIPRNRVGKEFLFIALQQALVKFNNESTGATMKHIRKSALEKVKTLCPPISIATDFQSIMEPIILKIILLERQNQKLKEARDLLLPRLMKGEMTV